MPNKVRVWPDFVKVKPRNVGGLKRTFEELSDPKNPAESGSDRETLKPIPLPLDADPFETCSALNVKLDLGLKCETILKAVDDSVKETIISFDTNWPPAYRPVGGRTSNIHICYGEGACAYFEISALERIPLVLIVLLKHSKVKLIGHNLKSDITRFSTDFKFDAQPILKNIKEPSSEDCEVNLSCQHGWKFKPENSDIVNGPQLIHDSRKDIAFEGKIEFCTSFEECAAFSYDLLSLANESSPLVLGFDLEWPFSSFGSGKTALIQICPNERICYIFHVFNLPKLPESLVRLISHKNVRLTGLNIINDLRKLGRDFALSQIGDVIRNNMIELTTFANRQLNSSVRWSLQGLCRFLLGYNLDKGPRKSSWDNINLTPKQLLYAATDAHVSRLCYLSLADRHGLQSGSVEIK